MKTPKESKKDLKCKPRLEPNRRVKINNSNLEKFIKKDEEE